MSCGVAIFILIVCIILIVYFTTRSTDTEDVADDAPHKWFITKDMWLAPEFNTTLRTDDYDPLRLVIIQHTVGTECTRFITCAAELRNLAEYYHKTYKYDLPYNFLIGNEGRVYEARGWNVVGAHTLGYNSCSMGLAFIGDYREGSPSFSKVTDLQLKRALMLFQEGIKQGYLHPDFQVVGAKDVQSSLSPGTNLYNAIRKWPNYAHKNIFRGRNCTQIYDLFKDDSTTTTLTTEVD